MNIRTVGPITERAEGVCGGFPYDTQLVSADGVQVIFWTGEHEPSNPTVYAMLQRALRAIQDDRDVVSAVACKGAPISYWNHADIEP